VPLGTATRLSSRPATGLIKLAPWLAVDPGLAIMLVVLGFNFLGDDLRDILEPRLDEA
jgi:peptide/nickel transport system permease protein